MTPERTKLNLQCCAGLSAWGSNITKTDLTGCEWTKRVVSIGLKWHGTKLAQKAVLCWKLHEPCLQVDQLKGVRKQRVCKERRKEGEGTQIMHEDFALKQLTSWNFTSPDVCTILFLAFFVASQLNPGCHMNHLSCVILQCSWNLPFSWRIMFKISFEISFAAWLSVFVQCTQRAFKTNRNQTSCVLSISRPQARRAKWASLLSLSKCYNFWSLASGLLEFERNSSTREKRKKKRKIREVILVMSCSVPPYM